MSRSESPDTPTPPLYVIPPRHRSVLPLNRVPTPEHERHHTHTRQQTAPSSSLSQLAIFRTAAPPLLFSVLIAGLLVELRARLAAPLPEAPPGIAVSMQGNTAMQRALIWAESLWPGAWALPVLCVGALCTLRAAIWAGATVLSHWEEQLGTSEAARVRVGRWEDDGSVSGSELLAGMFT